MEIPKKAFIHIFVLLVSLINPALSQDETGKNILIENLNEKIFILNSENKNSLLFTGNKENILIAEGSSAISSGLIEKISELNNKPIKFIVYSHIKNEELNNKYFVDDTVVFQQNALSRFSEKNGSQFSLITFNSEIKINIDEEEIDLLHFPSAHTDGDTVVYFKNSNLLFTGNTFYPDSFPLIDVEAGGSVRGYLDAVNRLVKISNRKTGIIPGSGPISNKKRLKEFQKMFKNSKNRIELMINADKDLSDILNEKPLDDFTLKWGSNTISSQDFTENLYQALTK